MNTINAVAAGKQAVPVAVIVGVGLNTLFLVINGLFMLFVPQAWYNFVPGVTDTGFFNQHFVRDIGMIQIFLGAGFAVGMLRPAVRFELWCAASVWLVAHALFHVWEVLVGICAASTLVRDFPAVSLPALVGVALAVWAGQRRATYHSVRTTP